jgi:hypothetical protein
MAMPSACVPTGTVADTVLVAVSITETVLTPPDPRKFVTYARFPSRLMATRLGLRPTGIVATPSWDSKTRWNNLLRDLAVEVTAGSSGHELTSSIVPRGTSFHR